MALRWWLRSFRETCSSCGRRRPNNHWFRGILDIETGIGKGYYSHQPPGTPLSKLRWKRDRRAIVVGSGDTMKVAFRSTSTPESK